MSEIIIRRGALSELGSLMKKVGCAGKAALVTDSNVAPLYLQQAIAALESEGFEVCPYTVEAGESSKCISCYARLLGFLADSALTRSDTVVALGGGVVGDLAGFASATYMRGVKLVQVPTSLLACVDSSIGGKTGIDLEQGKNLVGAFWQPVLTLIDPDLLRSLPAGVYQDGLAEVIKYGAIRSDIFDLLPYDLSEEEEVITRCVGLKRDIVSRDERDRGERQLLNFGHSFGHAFEKLSGYSLSHGRAVTAGMCAMARASYRLGLCREEVASRLIGMVHVLGLPAAAPYGAEEVYEAVLSDKKRAGERITLVMFYGIGDCRLVQYSMEELKHIVQLGLDR